MGPCAGVDYNLTLCPLQSRLQHIYHGQPYARVNLNPPILESTVSPSQGLWIWPQSYGRTHRICHAPHTDLAGLGIEMTHVTTAVVVVSQSVWLALGGTTEEVSFSASTIARSRDVGAAVPTLLVFRGILKKTQKTF